MKNKQIKNITLSAITAVIIAGCGSDGINEVYQLTDDKADYTVQVVDDAVVGASVSAAECSGYIELDEGYYTLTGCSSRPKAIMADGGYVALDDANVTMGFPLILNTNMVNVKDLDHYTATPLTTLLASADSYEELEDMKNALGFDSIQDMFKDDNKTRAIQQTLNSYFMEAQENGIDINNFFDFTDDFRTMIKEAHDSNATSDPIAAIKNGREKLTDDYTKNKSKYLKKYGVVFSGFVTSHDYKSGDGAKELLKKIGQKLNVDEGSLIFSGFVYDSFIDDANITMKDVTTNSFLDLNSTGDHTTWVMADEIGKYRLDLNKSQIIDSNKYLIEATKVKENNQTVVLNSLLTGTEILSKFKAKLNSSDIKDVTITNVTTAKTAFLEDANLLDANVSTIIAKKKEIEASQDLRIAAAAIKQVVDYNGSMGESNNTFEFAKKIVENQSVVLTDTDVTLTQVNTLVKEIEKDKTLKDQLTSTTYVAPTLQKSDIQDKVINFKEDNNINTTDIYLFNDSTYRLKGKDIKNKVYQYVGTWEVVNGKLQLHPSDSEEPITVTLPELATQSAPTVSDGKVTISATKRGSYGSIFFTINNVNKIDYTKETSPFIKFTENNIKNKTFYKLTQVGSEYDVTDMVYGTSWNAEDNGSLTADGTNYDITKSYPNRLETSNGILYFNQIDAEANSYIKAYDNNVTKVSISDNGFAVKAEVASSSDYSKKVDSYPIYLNEKIAIGATANMALTQNRGDSYRQTGTMNLSYIIPSCNEENDPGKLQVKVMIQQGRVAYKFTLVKSNGTTKDLSSAITILEENTYKKSYEIISLIKDNKLAIRVTDGLNEYYKYRELKELWENNPDLTYYKYPTQIGSTTFSAVLNDDGTSKQYDGKVNTPVELTVYNAYKINGNDSENNYEGGYCTVCNTGATVIDTPSLITSNIPDSNVSTPTQFTTDILSGHTFYEVYFDTSSDYDISANKSISKFVMNSDGTLSATGILGEIEGLTASGSWQVNSSGELETSITVNGETLHSVNTLQHYFTEDEWSYGPILQAYWENLDDSTDNDINFYHTTLESANAYGYQTNATE